MKRKKKSLLSPLGGSKLRVGRLRLPMGLAGLGRDSGRMLMQMALAQIQGLRRLLGSAGLGSRQRL
eukprot:8995279-Alexandrium_andersonii.AAC.1